MLVVAIAACGPDPQDSQNSSAPLPAPQQTKLENLTVDTAPPAEVATTTADIATPTFVGSATCTDCHPTQTAKWTGSHHDLAMQPATPATVLGDFNAASFEHHGLISRFRTVGEKFYVQTDGADGQTAEFEVLYAFGVHPLQQYLVSIGNGHLQALPFAWDTRDAAQSGHRWYHLYPDEPLSPDDPLHWTNANQNWNYMCAECHSTNLKKNYDPADRSFSTTWSEIDVACEACHGPASLHIEWANEYADADKSEPIANTGLTVALNSSNDRRWEYAKGASIAHLEDASPSTADQLQTCAPCHARRSVINDEFVHGSPLLDTYRLAHLVEPLYFIDGQIDDEVYVYGSFLQSKMHAAGVICSDCHDPHALGIDNAAATCARCHAASTFAQAAHTHHDSGTAGAGCLACHMPTRTYMGVDERHDHSFRVPRPDLSVDFDVPNPCSGCHPDQSTEWAAQQVVKWFPDGQTAAGKHFARTIAAGRAREPGAVEKLLALIKDSNAPAIVRATAVETIAAIPNPAAVTAMRAATADENPIVRHAAAQASENLPAQFRAPLLLPLLYDPVRAVRIAAAHSLSDVAPQALPDGARRIIEDGLDEYVDSERANLERVEARTNLGTLAAMRGQTDEALAQFEEAVAIDPFYVPAYVNWADLLRALGRDDEGERVLREGLEKVPDSPALHHTLGLLLHRTGRSGTALDELLIAADSENSMPRYIYVYAIALADAGHPDRSLTFLEQAHDAAPHDTEILFSLTTTYRDLGDYDSAIETAKKLAIEAPGSPPVQQLLDQLERRTPLPPQHPPVPGAPVH